MAINISKILAKTKKEYDDIMTQWIESSEIGHDVIIYYPPTYVNCDICQYSGWGNSTINSGPLPSVSSDCVQCGGTCQKEVYTTDSMRARLYSSDPSGFSPSLLKKLGVSYSHPDYQILMIAKVSDLKKVENSEKAQFYSNLEDIYGKKFFQLASDIRPHGFGKDKFFFCFWKNI